MIIYRYKRRDPYEPPQPEGDHHRPGGRRTKAKRRLAGDSYRTLSGYVRHLILAHIREAEALRGPIPDEEPLCPGPGRGTIKGI